MYGVIEMLASIANTVGVATVTNPRLGRIAGVGAASVAASATDAYALRVENLNVYYGKFRAVMDVALNIEARRITALIGPSGCGKSTVLRCFNRMNDLIPTARVEGNVEFRREEPLRGRCGCRGGAPPGGHGVPEG